MGRSLSINISSTFLPEVEKMHCLFPCKAEHKVRDNIFGDLLCFLANSARLYLAMTRAHLPRQKTISLPQ